jgi:asparagine synthase (glutamine-hydrolysing)
MPLSGGRDSRHILLALIEAGHTPDACVTVEHFPPRGNDDIAVAADVCRRLGVRHIVVPQRRHRLAVEREKNAATHYCTDEHAQFVALASWLREKTTITYDGIAGDVLSQSSYLTPEAHAVFERGDPEACARHVLDGYHTMVSERALSRLIAPAVFREVPRERAIAHLAREIAIHLDARNPIASFFFWNRTRREIALSPFALLHGITVYAPYLDRDVFDLLAGLPASLLLDRRFHTDAIARAYPRMAEVPYEARAVESRHPWLQRRLAAGLARVVAASGGLLNAGALAPGIVATMVDGNAQRLWHAPLAAYLGQLGELAALDR